MARTGMLRAFAIVAALAFVVSNINIFPPMDPQVFQPAEIIPFTGPLEYNERLRDSEKLFADKVIAPESIAEYQGALYAGTENGDIVKIQGDKYTALPAIPGGKDGKRRFLGLRVLGDTMYAVDAFNGFYTINLKTLKSELLLSSFDQKGELKYPFMDDLDIDPSTNSAYISLASQKHPLGSSFGSYVEFENSGSIIKFDMNTKKVEVLLQNLNFPNGIQLSKDGTSLLYSETHKMRIMKYHLKGEKKGSLEVFTQLPGFPDNLRASSRGYWIALPFARNTTTLVEDLANYPQIRKVLYRTASVVGSALEMVEKYIPNKSLKKLSIAIKSGAIFMALKPLHCMVVEVDYKGAILRSLQSSDVAAHCCISEVLEHKGSLYMGSFSNPHLLKLKLNK